MPKLGVNVDHIATLRQARGELDPNPISAARICEEAGADSIVAHLREDRRHIQDKDILQLKKNIRTRLNLEMSINPEIVEIAKKIKPHQATLVPEKRKEITTEGGLDVVKYAKRIQKVSQELQNKGIEVSLFIDPVKNQIEATQKIGISIVELHTGAYDHARTKIIQRREWKKIKIMTHYARSFGLTVHAGHGLNYHNTQAIAKIEGIEELNIGHAIISRAIFVGLKTAVKEMLRIVKG